MATALSWASSIGIESSGPVTIIGIELLLEILLILHIHIPMEIIVELIFVPATIPASIIVVILPSAVSTTALPVVTAASALMIVASKISLSELLHHETLHLLEVLLEHHHHVWVDHLEDWELAVAASAGESEHLGDLILFVLFPHDLHIALSGHF